MCFISTPAQPCDLPRLPLGERWVLNFRTRANQLPGICHPRGPSSTRVPFAFQPPQEYRLHFKVLPVWVSAVGSGAALAGGLLCAGRGPGPVEVALGAPPSANSRGNKAV